MVQHSNYTVHSYPFSGFSLTTVSLFGTIGKGIINLFREFVTGADSFGQLSNGISNSIVSGIVYWLIAAIVMGILFIITGFLIIGIGYQVENLPEILLGYHQHYGGNNEYSYRNLLWRMDKSVIPINLIVLLLLVYVVYIGIRCYVKDWREERGYY